MTYHSDGEGIPSTIIGHAYYAHKALQKLHEVAVKEYGIPESGNSEEIHINWNSMVSREEFADAFNEACKKISSDHAELNSNNVYCYHCRSSVCEHATPASCTTVFSEYGDTGRPMWTEFFNYLLSLGDNRIDRLFEERAGNTRAHYRATKDN